MTYSVQLTRNANADLLEILDWTRSEANAATARQVYEQIKRALLSLKDMPLRGQVPFEMQELGLFQYHHIVCGRYRVIYRIEAQRVMVVLIVDGHRDLNALLARRQLD